MKRWLLLGCFCLFFFDYGQCEAATVIMLEKVILDWKTIAGEESQQKLNINSYIHREWLELNLVNKFNYPRESGTYHNLELQFGFPKLVNGLEVDLDYDWNSRYRIVETGIEYAWKPLKGLRVEFDVDAGSKSALIPASERYRNNWDYQKIYLAYTLADWTYKLDCNRMQKEYPVTKYNTSTKINLEQELAWQLLPKLKLGVTYRESTGDYPYDTSLTKDYWKEEWSIWGKCKLKKNQNWNWKYRTLIWEKGFDPYQDNTYINSDYQWWSERWKLDAGLSWSRLNYLDETVIYDPDEGIDAYEDYKSRDEQRLSFTLTRYFDTAEWGFEFFSIRKDYINGNTENYTGMIAKIIWEIGDYKIRLNLAPFGNGSSSNDYYQIKLEYNPKDVVE